MIIKKRAVELDILSDVYKTQDGAAYNTPSHAIEDAVDNCLNGMNPELVSSDNPRKIQIIFHTQHKDGGIPHSMDIIDNGIGMNEETVLTSLFLTNIDNAGSNGPGGTSTWGMGYKAFTNYLGEPGDVFTRTIEQAEDGLVGTQAKVTYQKGEKPLAEVGELSEQLFNHELGEVATNGHGTKIGIRKIKGSKWPGSWWNPAGQTYSKSWSKRYSKLLKDGKLEIEVIQKTPTKVLRKTIEPSIYVLDNNPGLEVDKQDTDYLNCSRNGFNVNNEELTIEGFETPFNVNIGKHLSAMQKKSWDSIGKVPLIANSATKSANPTVYLYQNDILVATIPYKDSERTGGLNHLNGLFAEVFVPSNVRIPTNLQKTTVDMWFKDVVTKAVRQRAEEIWEPTDITEAAYHRMFQDLVKHPMKGLGIRTTIFDGYSVNDLFDGMLVHETQVGSLKPDFTYYLEDKVTPKKVLEFKDEVCNAEVSHQLAAYKLQHPTAEEIILVAPGFKETLTQTLNRWSKTSGTKFTYYSFADLGMTEITGLKDTK